MSNERAQKSREMPSAEAVLMPAGQPHARKALMRFKMLMTMIRS